MGLCISNHIIDFYQIIYFILKKNLKLIVSFSLVYFCRIFTKRHKNNLLRISCVLYGLFHLCSIFSIFGTNFFFPKNNLAFWQMMQGTIFHFLGLSSILMSFFKERSSHCTNKVLQANFPNPALIYIFRAAKNHTFT